jgi:hypothetical protein
MNSGDLPQQVVQEKGKKKRKKKRKKKSDSLGAGLHLEGQTGVMLSHSHTQQTNQQHQHLSGGSSRLLLFFSDEYN